MGYTFITPIYSIYLLRMIRQQPAYRTAGMRRMLVMPLLSLGWLALSGSSFQRTSDDLVRKYLNGITDYEIQNFEVLYQQVKASQ